MRLGAMKQISSRVSLCVIVAWISMAGNTHPVDRARLISKQKLISRGATTKRRMEVSFSDRETLHPGSLRCFSHRENIKLDSFLA
jgi:hypothetical protein